MRYVGLYKVAHDLVTYERRLHDLCSHIRHLLCINVPEIAILKRSKFKFIAREYY